MTRDEMKQFQYNYPLNIDSYEAKTKYGISVDEMMYLGGALAGPFLILKSITGLVLGVICAIVTFIMMKKFDALCGLSVPVFLFRRLKTMIRPEEITIYQIVPRIEATVQRYSLDDERIGIYGE